MICEKCKNENREDSKFCRFCGNKIASEDSSPNLLPSKFFSYKILLKERIFKFKKGRFSKKQIILSLIIFLASVTSVFAAPKANDYIQVRKSVKIAEEFQASGDYKNALASLISTDSRWTLSSVKEEINRLKERQELYLGFQEKYNLALEKEKEGLFTEARDLLQSINPEYPKYQDVHANLLGVQAKIENELQEKVKVATEAEIEARKKAEGEATAKVRAQAAATAATDAKARAEADAIANQAAARVAQDQAAAAAQAARNAELKRQQEAFIKFVDEVVTIYVSINNGESYLSQAANYLKSDNSLSAAAANLQAQSIFDDADTRSQNLLTYRTPEGYSYVGNNLRCAANNASSMVSKYNQALVAIANGSYSLAQYYIDQGASYSSAYNDCFSVVRTFLYQQGR